MTMFSSPHIILMTRDIARATTFYAGLGFTEAFRVPPNGDPVHVDLQLDDYRIGFATEETAREEHSLEPVTSGHRAVIVLWTSDITAALDRLLFLGATLIQDPKPFLHRLTVAFVQDPDGHAIQLVQETPTE